MKIETITDEMVERALAAWHPNLASVTGKLGGWSTDARNSMRAALEAALPAAAPHVMEEWLEEAQLKLASAINDAVCNNLDAGIDESRELAARVAASPTVKAAIEQLLPSPPAPAAGREAVLEEAARVAENYAPSIIRCKQTGNTEHVRMHAEYQWCANIAAAIRALASKHSP